MWAPLRLLSAVCALAKLDVLPGVFVCSSLHAALVSKGECRPCAAMGMQVMSKRGVDIAYVGGGSSVIAAGGYSAEGGNIALWDTMAALSAGPIASLDHHSSLVTALQVALRQR